MPEVDHLPVIKRLPGQLANQIAAGEVIERPASVLKELIENALDAGATRIDIELQKGGMEHIAVTDNGCGIHTDELALAISRHATSKIAHVDDLLNLQSLGFRGEALASICSVSQWELISRPETVKQAAQISYRLPDEVIEINHPPGTRVSIKHLFHTTPARKKFLRAEQTEFRHCYDVIKRISLACFDVAFYVKHNGRQILRLPAVNDDIGRSRRIVQVCGESFIKQSFVIDYPRNAMRLWGWISQPDYSRQSTDLQYFYINGRIIRDRVINHAIRFAYQHALPAGRHAAYVLHLDVDPSMVDVNVHPTKHEVRFRESRVIHDFVSRSIRESLQPQLNLQQPVTESHSYSSLTAAGIPGSMPAAIDQPGLAESQAEYQRNTASHFGKLVALVKNQFALTQSQEYLYLVDLQQAATIWLKSQWYTLYKQQDIKSTPLLLPERTSLNENELNNYHHNKTVLDAIGFEFQLLEGDVLLIRKIPSLLQAYDSKAIIQSFLEDNYFGADIEEVMSEALKDKAPDYTKLELNILFDVMSQDIYAHCWREITSIDLQDWLSRS